MDAVNLEGQKFGALALGNFCANPQFQTTVMEHGAVANLVGVLSQEQSLNDSKSYASFALANLAALPANHALLIESNVVGALCSFLNQGDPSSFNFVSKGFANLCSVSLNHTAIVESGGIQAIIGL